MQHADCRWLSLRGPLGRPLGSVTRGNHTKQLNTNADCLVPFCKLPYVCLTASAEVGAAGTPAVQPFCDCSMPAASRPLNPSCHMQVALGIVLHCEKSLLKMEDMEEMVDFLKSEVGPANPA